jgi:predicted DNA-binding transcriptional regulator YafY
VNRTDRLYAIVEALRARAPRPLRAVELARRFEVTTRTVERDLAALQQTGVPIWAQPGPGGGYGLDPSSTMPPLNLTPDEATAIAVALAAAGGMPFAGAGRSALQKLIAVMPPGQVAAAGRLTARMALTTDEPIAPEATAQVEEAIRDNRAIEIDYLDRNDQATSRTVEPAALIGGHLGWYMLGFCRLRQDGRAFRLDRIKAAHVTAERITPRTLEELVANDPIPGLRPLGALVPEE